MRDTDIKKERSRADVEYDDIGTFAVLKEIDHFFLAMQLHRFQHVVPGVRNVVVTVDRAASPIANHRVVAVGVNLLAAGRDTTL